MCEWGSCQRRPRGEMWKHLATKVLTGKFKREERETPVICPKSQKRDKRNPKESNDRWACMWKPFLHMWWCKQWDSTTQMLKLIESFRHTRTRTNLRHHLPPPPQLYLYTKLCTKNTIMAAKKLSELSPLCASTHTCLCKQLGVSHLLRFRISLLACSAVCQKKHTQTNKQNPNEQKVNTWKTQKHKKILCFCEIAS